MKNKMPRTNTLSTVGFNPRHPNNATTSKAPTLPQPKVLNVLYVPKNQQTPCTVHQTIKTIKTI